MLKNILKYCAIFIVIICIFISTLYVTSLIPASRIKENVAESAEKLLQESNRKKVYIKSKDLIMQFDNYTDALMINTAYSIDSSKPLYSAFTAKKNYIPGITKTIERDRVSELKSASKYGGYHNEVGELHDVVNNDIDESFEYARYWHGYLILLRPLLILFNIVEIRVILTVLFTVLAMILLYQIYKKTSVFIAIIFLVALAGIEYFYIGISIHEAPIFIIMMVASIYLLKKDGNIKSISVMFLILGMLTNFFDLLSVPILTYGFPILIYFLVQQKNKNLTFKESTIIFIKTGISWLVGYALTWLTKWILIDIIYKRNLIEIGLGQVKYRSIGSGMKYSYIVIVASNLVYVIVPLILSVSIGIAIRIIQGTDNIKLKEIFEKKYPYIVIGIMPFILYKLLSNHSINHSFFTYRNLLLALSALPIAICFSSGIYNKKINIEKRREK